MSPLKERIAVVTGASRGIGAAIAKRLAAEGATVVCSARTLEAGGQHLPGSLQEVVAAIESAGGRAAAVRCDVSDPHSRAQMMDEVLARFGRVDILVNNAAGATFAGIDKVTDASLQWQFEINVFGPLDLCQRALPGMRERGWGRIVNISSAQAEMPKGPPFLPNDRYYGPLVYGMTKVALNRFTAGLAAELEGSGIAVNSVAPVSAVYTEGVAAMLSHDASIRSDPLWQEEPVEAMAEAALALCLVDAATTSGRNVYSLHYLKEIDRPVHTLDGSAVLDF
jgi:NAD(P)-dependent dehydrogenase (short-subunit alcohol dehydrogenase family)